MEETLALNDSAPSLHLADPRVVVNSVSHIINIYIYIFIYIFYVYAMCLSLPSSQNILILRDLLLVLGLTEAANS